MEHFSKRNKHAISTSAIRCMTVSSLVDFSISQEGKSLAGREELLCFVLMGKGSLCFSVYLNQDVAFPISSSDRAMLWKRRGRETDLRERRISANDEVMNPFSLWPSKRKRAPRKARAKAMALFPFPFLSFSESLCAPGLFKKSRLLCRCTKRTSEGDRDGSKRWASLSDYLSLDRPNCQSSRIGPPQPP